MRYSEVKVGETVLYNERRTSNPKFKMRQCERAIVLATGVDHSYWTRGSWTETGHRVSTEQGVRVRIGERTLVTVAAHLLPANEENLAQIAALEEERKEAEQSRRELAERVQALKARFDGAGFPDVHVSIAPVKGAYVEVRGDDVARLIRRLEGER